MVDDTEVSKFKIDISLLTERFKCSHLFESVPNSVNFLSIIEKETSTVQARGSGGRFGRSSEAPSAKR